MKKFKERIAKLSIKYHIIIAMVLFFTGAVIAVCLVFNLTSDFVYRTTKVSSAKRIATYLVNQISGKEGSQEKEALENLTLENDVCALVTNVSTGSKELVSIKGTYCPIANLSSFSIQTLFNIARENAGKITLYSSDINNVNILQVSEKYHKNKYSNVVQVETTNDSIGNNIAVIVSSFIRPRNVTNSIFWNQALVIIIVFLLCSIAVSLVLTKIIAKPINRLNLKAMTLAKGEYNVKFDGKGYKEISQLSDTLNYAASELSKVDNLKNELIANVSHDLRTPLTMISGYGEIIRDIPDENTKENVQVIIDEANRLNSMVNNLLDLSKLQSGNIKMEKSKFNLSELLREIIKEYQTMIKDFSFDLKQEGKDVFVLADKIRIGQVIENLLNNAITYSKEKKVVTITQTIKNDKVRIDIIDYGKGVSEEELPYIWDRYYKIDESHDRAITGSGLGLSIVKEILKEHSALYGVESQIDKGSDFYFQLDYSKSE